MCLKSCVGFLNDVYTRHVQSTFIKAKTNMIDKSIDSLKFRVQHYGPVALPLNQTGNCDTQPVGNIDPMPKSSLTTSSETLD